MKLQIKTDVLKEMVSKAVQGASCNKLAPLTNMMAIELKGNKLTLHTTDMSNHLYIMEENVEGDDFYVTVFVEQFSKLIGKLTCSDVSMELKENSLEVKGNGKYEIELPLDEEGALVKFPDPYNNNEIALITNTIELSAIHAILNTAKASLAPEEKTEHSFYSGYYVGDKVITTDTCKICCMKMNLLDKPVLISTEMMDLLNVMTSEKVSVRVDEDKSIVIFDTNDCVVYGYMQEGINDFDVKSIGNLLDSELDCMCKVLKSNMLATLERIALFVGAYDNKAVVLNFTKSGVNISSMKSSGIENVEYMESENAKDFTALIDIEMLISQLKAYAGDVVEIHYSHNQFMSLVNGNTTQIIAFLEDEDNSEEE